MSRFRRIALPIAVPLFAVALWQVVALKRNNPFLFPTIGSIFGTSLPSFGVFYTAGTTGYTAAISALSFHAAVTISRIACGLAFGGPLGIAFGVLTHLLRGSGPVSALPLIMVRSVPLLALIPLFSFWFGSSGVGVVTYIAFGVFVVTASDAFEAMANLSPALIQLAGLLGAQRWFVIRTVYLPGIGRHMAASIRNVVGLTWALSLGAEYISASSGLGYITYQSYLYTDMGKLALLGFIYVLLGYASYELTQRLLARLLRWQP